MIVIKSIVSFTHDTTENWNKYPTFVPKRGECIAYDDWHVIEKEDGTKINVPGFKMGDGNAYLVDLPFVGEGNSSYTRSEVEQMIQDHAGDLGIHVTTAEKEFWNNKVSVRVEGENLIFTTD